MSLDLYTGSGPSSGYDDATYRYQREPRGRAVPFGSYRRTSGPNGITETETMPLGGPVSPSQPQAGGAPVPFSGARSPQVVLSPTDKLRRQNMGLVARGPSPYSTTAVQQRAAVPFTGGADASGAGGEQSTQHYRPGSAEWGRINRAYHDAQKTLTDMDPNGPGYAEHTAYIASLRSQLGMDSPKLSGTSSGMAVPFHPMSSGGAAQAPATGAAPVPFTPPPQPASPNYVRRGPNLPPEAPLSTADRNQRVQQMYATAANSLNGVGDMGSNGTPNYGPGGAAPVAPRTEFTYSDTAAHKAVEMGTGQARSNEAAMRRGEQRRVGAINDASAAQFGQNMQAQHNVAGRLDQFARGDYDLSHAPGASAPAGGAVAGGQQLQQQGLTNFHVNPQTGERIGWDGKQWQKAQ